MARASEIGRFLLSVCCLPAIGCVQGPFWLPEPIALPPLAPHGAIQRVAVSDFYGSHLQEGRQPRDRMAVSQEGPRFEITAEVASEFRAAGLQARAIVGGRPDTLEEGEVLVRGSVRSLRPALYPEDGLQLCACCCTAGLYGAVVPFFTPIHAGTRFEVNVDVRDRRDTVLMGYRKEVEASYTLPTVWAEPDQRQPARRLWADLESRVVADLARRLRE